jgi:hypothetical protein
VHYCKRTQVDTSTSTTTSFSISVRLFSGPHIILKEWFAKRKTSKPTELLTQIFTETLPLQHYYTLLQEARQEKGETAAQFLHRLREISAKTIRKGSITVECAILAEEGRYRLLSVFIHGCSGPVGPELRFRAPEKLESALRIAITVDSDRRREREYRRKWPIAATAVAVGIAAGTVLWYAGKKGLIQQMAARWRGTQAKREAEQNSPTATADQPTPESPAGEAGPQQDRAALRYASPRRIHLPPV